MATGSRRQLSPRAALVLVGLFAVLALVAWGLNAARSSGTATTTASATTKAAASAKASSAQGSSSRPSSTRVLLDPPSSGAGSGAIPPAPPASASLRTKALYVLAVVDATGDPPSGYVGGRQFMNDGRGGTTPLPARTTDGRRIVYHEYDVNPKRQGVDRGPQRLVLGDDGTAYMTGDHYVTWGRLR